MADTMFLLTYVVLPLAVVIGGGSLIGEVMFRIENRKMGKNK